MRTRWFSTFFFFSGFCSLLYEVIWVRLGMSYFGVTTPVTSIFISLFMAGLGLGSWISGRSMRNIEKNAGSYPLRLYALTELLIGFSALAVPVEMEWAKNYLQNYGSDLSVSSLQYYWIAGRWLALILLPWCTCMGATFPLAMAAIRKMSSSSQSSFSFLYVANVLGAIVGALLPAFVLVEIFGFRGTMKLAAICNLMVSIAAFLLSLRPQIPLEEAEVEPQFSRPPSSPVNLLLGLLFLTGLVSLAMEVVWIRQFTAYIGTEVYSFAWILSCYLLGTFAGSRIYRKRLPRHQPGEETAAWLLLGSAGLLPLLMSDPRLFMPGFLRVALGILPVTGLMGYVTPMLVDQFSDGDPERAGTAYAVNVVGCILGPLLSSFLFLPYLGERWSLILLTMPLFFLLYLFRPKAPALKHYGMHLSAAMVVVAFGLIIFTKDFVTKFAWREVRRDYAATAMATGQGMTKQLFVNGYGMTSLTSATKMMAHIPLALHTQPPKDALVICFGMGTTYRSLLSWGISATAVELMPSVPQLFGYFHNDGTRLLQSPNSHLIIDDGRQFLEKTRQQFDVITIDPPPPTSAAGVSLLYSAEFYEIAARRLRSEGILQVWTVGDDPSVNLVAIAKALNQSFRYVRCLLSVGGWGYYFIASMSPLPRLSGAELASRMPRRAVADLVEWGPGATAEAQFALLISREIPLDGILDSETGGIQALDDDRPVNEYYLLRSMLPSEWSRVLYEMIARWR